MHATIKPSLSERLGAHLASFYLRMTSLATLFSICVALQTVASVQSACPRPQFVQNEAPTAIAQSVSDQSDASDRAGKQHQATESKYQWPYPQASSKKGLQVELVDDALAAGIKHAGLNINLSQLVYPDAPANEVAGPQIKIDGQAYHFRQGYLTSLDRQVQALSDAGVLVNVILLTYLSNDPHVNSLMIHPDCDKAPPNGLGAFNNRTAEGRAWLHATIQFLAERWSRPDKEQGRVVGWIVGNEVNSHWWWSNMGRVTLEQFCDDYEQVLRIVHTAVRSQSANSRVYVSLEHHWSIRYPAGDETQAFPGRSFLEHFAALVKQRGDFDWHVAFHPYPENLFDAAFWEDTSATDDDLTERVTPRNLQVLVRFLNQPELQTMGQSRRIILSEQGFHSAANAASELQQAAAYCYAYRLIDQFPSIDAFILHRHIDHPHEGGLNLGLRRRAATGGSIDEQYPKKPIYDCFLAADREDWRQVFEFALPLVGLKEWP